MTTVTLRDVACCVITFLLMILGIPAFVMSIYAVAKVNDPTPTLMSSPPPTPPLTVQSSIGAPTTLSSSTRNKFAEAKLTDDNVTAMCGQVLGSIPAMFECCCVDKRPMWVWTQQATNPFNSNMVIAWPSCTYYPVYPVEQCNISECTAEMPVYHVSTTLSDFCKVLHALYWQPINAPYPP